MSTSPVDPLTNTNLLVETVAPAEAQQPATRGLSIFYTLAAFGSWIALITPIAVTMALRVHQIDPAHDAADLGLVLGIGAFFPVVIGPIAGQLSDRTTSRFGMRRPWIMAGALGGFVGLLIAATAPSIPIILLGWCLTQFMFSVSGAGMQAIIPDQVPEDQRGKLSGLVGMAQQFGTAFGIGIAAAVNGNLFLAFIIPALIGLVALMTLAAVLRDRRLSKESVEPFNLPAFVKGFWVSPRRYPDFGWAFIGRFLVSLGLAVYGNYAVLFLIHRLNYSPAQVPGLLLIGTLITIFTTTVAAIGGGILSDRLKRRKVFVIGAALIYTLGMVIIAFAPSFAVYLLGGGLAGAAIGTYSAVDLAMVTQVLPNKGANAAKDMGVFGIASVLPQSLAPAMAPLFLAIGGGNNYVALYLAAAIFGLLGAVATQPIKGVR